MCSARGWGTRCARRLGEKLKQIHIKFVVLPEAAEFASRRLSFATSYEEQPACIAEQS